MFTTEPPLAQRIERLIDATPIVDPHTHLRVAQPAAPDLGALMSYHWLQSELHAVGMPKSDLDPALPVEERVKRSLPYLARMRNTAMSWCFHKILRDLFGLEETTLTDANYQVAIDSVASAARDDAWPETVLGRKCNIRTVVTSLGNALPVGKSARLGVDVFYMLDAHYLFCPGVATDLAPFFVGRTRKDEYAAALFSILPDRPDTTARLGRDLRDWLERTVSGRTTFSNTFIPIEQRFVAPDTAETDRALTQAALDRSLTDADIDALVRAVSWEVLGWHHERKKAFQIAVGAEYFICDGKSIPRIDPRWTSEMAPAFHHFGNARFDLMMAAEPHMQDMCVLARQFPNIYLSGYWWHSFFPSLIEKAASLRLQIAPATKFAAFLCDAYYCEWTYGKLQVVRKALAASLAGLVESRFLDEDTLPDLLRQILHDTPRDLYELHAS